VRRTWIIPIPPANQVDKLIAYSTIYALICGPLRDLEDIPGLDQEPGPFADDPPDLNDETFANLLGEHPSRLGWTAPVTPPQPLFPISENVRTAEYSNPALYRKREKSDPGCYRSFGRGSGRSDRITKRTQLMLWVLFVILSERPDPRPKDR